MIEKSRYLKAYFSLSQPFEKVEKRYSSLILALKNARLITNRDVNKGKVSFKIKAPLAPSNLGGAILYLIVLELIGVCFKRINKKKEKGNPIYLALRNFSSLSINQSKSIEALRHSFAHSYGLININKNKKNIIVQELTHHFSLTADPKGKLINERNQFWDGLLETRNKNNVTEVNLWKLGDLVESVFETLLAENNKENVDLILPKYMEELKAKYTVIL